MREQLFMCVQLDTLQLVVKLHQGHTDDSCDTQNGWICSIQISYPNRIMFLLILLNQLYYCNHDIVMFLSLSKNLNYAILAHDQF